MNDANKKIMDMVAAGKITTGEADALLAAMRPSRRFAIRSLFDPYDKVGLWPALAVGLAASAASAAAAVALGIRFDGFLDIHVAPGPVSAADAVADQVVAWPLSAVVLWLVALPFARQSRVVDFLAATGLARVLLLIAGLLLVPLTPNATALARMSQNAVSNPAAVASDLVSMIPMIAVALVFVTWFIVALVFAFRHASGLRGGRLAGAFVAALIAAEIVSKLALWAAGAILGG